MPAHITLVRHAETFANVEHRWQGATDTSFSERGNEQIALLAKRFSDITADIVVTSDLGRARGTVAGLGHDFDDDPRWREPNVGEWEGLRHNEIRARFPDQMAALMRGEDVSLGGGERMSDVAARLREAFDDLCSRLGEDGTAIVVSHGLALLTLTADLLGTIRPAPLQLMVNTGVTTFSVNSVGPQLVRYNDGSHLGDPGRGHGHTHVFLIRHGETEANVEGRWQGHGDWPLNANGRDQAARLAPTLPPVAALYSSPLLRARTTAEVIADRQGHDVRLEEGLREIGFGSWENLTRAELEEVDPEGIAHLVAGEDIARGGTGETFGEVQRRMTETVGEIARRHAGEAVGIVSHGGATRAFLTSLLGIGFPDRNRIRTLNNTAYGRVAFGERGPQLGTWNAAPHLAPDDDSIRPAKP